MNEQRKRLCGFYYIDFSLLRAASLGRVPDRMLAEFAGVMCISECTPVYPHTYDWCTRMLELANVVALAWNREGLGDRERVPGDICWVDHAFRTKGVGYWGINDYRIGSIYARTRTKRLTLVVDPRWIYSDGGHIRLRSGHTRLAGLFQVVGLSSNGDETIGVPIVLGAPVTALGDAVFPGSSFPACRLQS